jgi:arsenate reductase (glutaredoxin)
MKTHLREILIYYNPDSNSHRMTVAHAQSMVAHVRTYPFGQTPSMATSWLSILNSIGRPTKELLNKALPYYQANIRGKEFSDSNWIKILRNNPELLKAPIAIRGTRAILCEKPTDIYKLVEPAPTV